MEQVKVILKLFVVMGVTWLSELCYFVVGWAVGREIVWKYFAINDFINFSQGSFIYKVKLHMSVTSPRCPTNLDKKLLCSVKSPL